jgi:hypothetical protein
MRCPPALHDLAQRQAAVREDVDRFGHRVAHRADLLAVAQPGGVEDVGARALVGLQAGDGVLESGLPRMWFSARAVRVKGTSRACAGLHGRRHAPGGVLERVDPAARVVVLDRGADGAGARRRARWPRARPGAVAPVAVLEFDREPAGSSPDQGAACSTTSSSGPPARRARPMVKAKPELVLASALKPRPARTLAEPASHGLGMTNGSPSCSARKSAPFSCCVGGMRHMMRTPTRAPFARRRLPHCAAPNSITEGKGGGGRPRRGSSAAGVVVLGRARPAAASARVSQHPLSPLAPNVGPTPSRGGKTDVRPGALAEGVAKDARIAQELPA